MIKGSYHCILSTETKITLTGKSNGEKYLNKYKR